MSRNTKNVVMDVISGALVVAFIAILIMAVVFGATRIPWDPTPEKGPNLSERQKAVRDVAAPCPGGKAQRVDLDEGDVEYDVSVVCVSAP